MNPQQPRQNDSEKSNNSSKTAYPQKTEKKDMPIEQPASNPPRPIAPDSPNKLFEEQLPPEHDLN